MRVFSTFCVIWLACLSLSVQANERNVICYWGSWSVYRTGNGQVLVSDLDPTLCTHMIYTFTGLTADGEVNILDAWNDLSVDGGLGNMGKFVNLSSTTKMMVSMGGWNEGSERYSNVLGNSTLRSTLVESIVNFLETYGFEGFDFDWEYPNQRNGVETDIENFVLFLKELYERFQECGFVLSVAVAAAESSASLSYNVSGIAEAVDFINLMTYDFHSSSGSIVAHNTPLYNASWETTESERSLNIASKKWMGFNHAYFTGCLAAQSEKKTSIVVRYELDTNASVHYWLDQGMPAEKIMLGTAAYGKSFNLTYSDETQPGSPSNGPGPAGPYTQEAGTLSYLEILALQNESDWTVAWDEEQDVPYAYYGNEWITYDNERSIIEKVEYAKAMGLGGLMIWSLESDDVHGIYGRSFPLLTALNDALNDASESC